MPIAPADAASTYAKRLRQYQRRLSTILWVLAGLAALIGLLSTSLADGAPRAILGAVASLIVVGGGSLATARIQFDWAATELSRAIEDGAAANAPLPAALADWPKLGEVAWLGGLLCVPAAAIAYLVAMWLAIA